MRLTAETRGALAPCSICGGQAFGPGPNGRPARSGLPPRCLGCGSLERHRVIRGVYGVLPDSLLAGASVLQFSPDIATPAERFARVEVSVHGGPNDLDITAIARADASYDWAIANHVIEHVADDRAALAELLRIVTPQGVVQVSVPTPSTALETWQLDAPDPRAHGHYRGYGSDFPLVVAPALKGAVGLQVVGHDPVSGAWDVVYFFTRSIDVLTAIGRATLGAGLVALRCA